MSVELQLQQRLEEPQGTMNAAAQNLDLSEAERLCIAIRQQEAKVKAEEEKLTLLKDEAKELTRTGEIVGGESANGYYTFTTEQRKTFDWKKAAMNGLFTEQQAAPFMKETTVEKFVFKKNEEKK